MPEKEKRKSRIPSSYFNQHPVHVMENRGKAVSFSKVSRNGRAPAMPLQILPANDIPLFRQGTEKIRIAAEMPLHSVDYTDNAFLLPLFFVLPQLFINLSEPVARLPIPLSSLHDRSPSLVLSRSPEPGSLPFFI